MSERSFDIIIVGAGVSGVLLAQRLAATGTGKVALLDRQGHLGGHRVSRPEASWCYGFNSLSRDIMEHWDRQMRRDPDSDGLWALIPQQTKSLRFGVLSGSKVDEMDASELFSAKGMRFLGGMAAGKLWPAFAEILQRPAEENAVLAEAAKEFRKGALGSTLEQLTSVIGLPSLWEASVHTLRERIEEFQSTAFVGDLATPLKTFLEETITRPTAHAQLERLSGCEVFNAKYENELWQLSTTNGALTARTLVVAHSPWTAVKWLAKAHMPSSLAAIASKAKPVSAVTLSAWIEEKTAADLPDFLLIPAEDCVAMRCNDGEVVLRTAIDHEQSLQAPDVVKAAKRLRRGLKRLQTQYQMPPCVHEHLALVPQAWGAISTMSELKYFHKLNNAQFQKRHLLFCGDAYGGSGNGERNLLSSLSTCSDMLLKEIHPEG